VKRLFIEFARYVREHPDEVFAAIWQASRPRKEVF
jgi:hypothetical protein